MTGVDLPAEIDFHTYKASKDGESIARTRSNKVGDRHCHLEVVPPWVSEHRNETNPIIRSTVQLEVGQLGQGYGKIV